MTASTRPLPLSTSATMPQSNDRHRKPLTWSRPEPSALLMRLLGTVNRTLLLRGYFRVRRLDIPESDFALLRSAVNPATAAFMGPNHPEFGCDWMMDKEISMLVAPRMASWADRGIVASAPAFWAKNNLIANDGGDAAREYSVESALRGDHVLLHPEGTVRWTSDHVHALFPGIAQMAMAAAERTDKPVYMVPLVWKLRYEGNISRALHREMKSIEDTLSIARSHSKSVGERFAALQENVLVARMKRFGYEPLPKGDFFTRQETFQQHLMEILAQRYAAGDAESIDRRIARIMKMIRARLAELRGDDSAEAVAERAHRKHDLECADEAKRLGEFSRACYGAPMLTQEHVAESLKRMRDRLCNRTTRQRLANMLPRPYGTRIAHVGVPAPIRVERVSDREKPAYERALLELMRASMQAKLDEINLRISSEMAAFKVVNTLGV
jgi:hypothetical protein